MGKKQQVEAEYRKDDVVVYKFRGNAAESKVKDTHGTITGVAANEQGEVVYTIKNWKSGNVKDYKENAVVGLHYDDDEA